jgi:hypothetical protein
MGDTDADREPAFGPAPAGCDAPPNALGQRPGLRALPALAIGVGAASVREIDRLNIRRASILAMERALAASPNGLDELLIRFVNPSDRERFLKELEKAGWRRPQ